MICKLSSCSCSFSTLPPSCCDPLSKRCGWSLTWLLNTATNCIWQPSLIKLHWKISCQQKLQTCESNVHCLMSASIQSTCLRELCKLHTKQQAILKYETNCNSGIFHSDALDYLKITWGVLYKSLLWLRHICKNLHLWTTLVKLKNSWREPQEIHNRTANFTLTLYVSNGCPIFWCA